MGSSAEINSMIQDMITLADQHGVGKADLILRVLDASKAEAEKMGCKAFFIGLGLGLGIGQIVAALIFYLATR